MKPKRAAGLALLACAGLAAAFGLATPGGADTGRGTGTGTTATAPSGEHGKGRPGAKGRTAPACRPVVLAGQDGSGAVSFTVKRAAGRQGSDLVGKQVSLTIPSGTPVAALACSDSSGALTLRELRVLRAPGQNQK
jgi:hypothetical protein